VQNLEVIDRRIVAALRSEGRVIIELSNRSVL